MDSHIEGNPANGNICASEAESGDIRTDLPLDRIRALPENNPRRYFDPVKLAELVEDIRQRGIMQNLVVRAPDADGIHDLIFGGRRFRAAQTLGLATVPVVIKHVDDATAALMAASENYHRVGLSPAEEARHAQKVVDDCDGDLALAARQLTWEVAKLRARLALLHCTEPVLAAVDEQKITPLHAELLSTLTHKKQNDILDTLLVHPVSAQVLRDQMSVYGVALASAPFDISKTCQLCKHNSAVQLGLFGNALDEARCSNKACFSELSSAALNEKRATLKESFATVKLYTEAVPETVVLLQDDGPSGVGEVQLATGCKACAFYGAIIEDRLIPSIGTVSRGHCFDAQGCHKEMVAAYRKVIATPVITTDAASSDDTNTKKGAAGKASSTPATTLKKGKVGKAASKAKAKALPSTVVAFAEQFYQRVAASVIDTDPSAALAVALLATEKLPMPSGSKHPLDTAAPVSKGHLDKERSRQRMEKLAALNVDQLTTLAKTVATACLVKSPAATRFNADYDPVRLAHALVAAKAVDLRGHFTMSPDFLRALTLNGIELVVEESGFGKWFVERNDGTDKALRKLLTGDKKTVIERVMAAGFDWSGYVPAALRQFRHSPNR